MSGPRPTSASAPTGPTMPPPFPPPEFTRAIFAAFAESMQPMADMFAQFSRQIAEGFAQGVAVPVSTPGGSVAGLAKFLGYRDYVLRSGEPAVSVRAGVGGRRGRRRRRAEERRAMTADVYGPYVCPGCYAVGGEKCAVYCPDAAIEAQREHDRETREMYDDEEPGDDDDFE